MKMKKTNDKFIKVSNFCQLVTDGTHSSPKKLNFGFKLITSQNIKNYAIDFSKCAFISEEDYNKINVRSKIEQYDVLYSMIGTIGNIYIEESMNIDYVCKNIGIFKIGGDLIKSRFLFYYLQSPYANEYLKNNQKGTTQKYVTLENLRNLPVLNISKDEMRSRICLLEKIDRQISLLNQINDNLFDCYLSVH